MEAGVLDSENNGRIQWQPSPIGRFELSQTNRGVGGVCVGVVPRVQSKLSRALHAHRGKKLLQDLQTQESAATKRAMVRFRGAREKGAMAFVECLGFSQEDTMEGPLWRETLGRSLGSHDATELVGGMCHGNGCWQETTRFHAISCSKTGWSSLTHNRVLHQALARSLRKSKALLLDITIVNPCAGSNLGNAARHVGKHLADAVERKKNKYRGSFPATYSLLSLAMSTCGDVGSDVHALIKELAIRRVQHRSETYSNESQHLAEGTEVSRLRRRFSFVLQHSHSARVTISADRGWRLRAPEGLIRKAQRRYKRIVPGGQPDPRGRKERTGSWAGLESGVGTETVTGTWTVKGTGAERERERGWKRMKERRTGTGTGAGTGRGRGRGRGWGPLDEHRMGTGTTITGTRIGLGRAEGRRKSARNRQIAVDAARETGETWVESEKNVEKKGLVQ